MPAADREQKYEPEIPSPSRTDPPQFRRKPPDVAEIMERLLGFKADGKSLVVYAIAAVMLAAYAVQVWQGWLIDV